MNSQGPPDDSSEGLVTVLETFDATQVMVVRSMLEAAAIPVEISGQDSLGFEPAIQRAVSGLFGRKRAKGIQIKVPEGNLSEAQALLAPFEGSEDGEPGS